MIFNHYNLVTFHALSILSFFSEKARMEQTETNYEYNPFLISHSFTENTDEHTWVITTHDNQPVFSIFATKLNDYGMLIRTVVYGDKPVSFVTEYNLNLPIRSILGKLFQAYRAVTYSDYFTPVFEILSSCLIELDDSTLLKSVHLSTAKLVGTDDRLKRITCSIGVNPIPLPLDEIKAANESNKVQFTRVVELSIPLIPPEEEDEYNVDEILIRKATEHEFYLLKETKSKDELLYKSLFYQKGQPFHVSTFSTVFKESDDKHFWFE